MRWRSVGAFAFALTATMSADALEFSAGVGAGATSVGTRPLFAVSPHAGVSVRTEGGFLLASHATLGILPAVGRHGVGVYGHASVALGYAWKSGRFSIGPSLAIYSVPACGREWCDRLSGLAPGLGGRLDYYLVGPFGISVSTNVDWLTGSTVLPAGVAATVLAGPLLRWSRE